MSVDGKEWFAVRAAGRGFPVDAVGGAVFAELGEVEDDVLISEEEGVASV